jgi:hypothetical protein
MISFYKRPLPPAEPPKEEKLAPATTTKERRNNVGLGPWKLLAAENRVTTEVPQQEKPARVQMRKFFSIMAEKGITDKNHQIALIKRVTSGKKSKRRDELSTR